MRNKSLCAELLNVYKSCAICPWECGCNRFGKERGRCNCGVDAVVSDYMPHFGEEKCLVGEDGSGAIFFAFCNLSCVFCQTYEMSQEGKGTQISSDELANIMIWLQEAGCHNINLVTPTHIIPSIVCAIEKAKSKGLNLPIIYNTGGYDRVETLKKLEGVVDIYLPDFKFWKRKTAKKLCGAENYPGVVKEAIKEMHRQVGDLEIDLTKGLAKRGLLIRHLVLPGLLDETEEILKFIVEEISPDTYVNIMGHYHPCGDALNFPEINRTLTKREFERALEIAKRAGLRRLDTTHWHLLDTILS